MTLVVKKAELGPVAFSSATIYFVACSSLAPSLAAHSHARWDIVSTWKPQRTQVASALKPNLLALEFVSTAPQTAERRAPLSAFVGRAFAAEPSSLLRCPTKALQRGRFVGPPSSFATPMEGLTAKEPGFR